MIIQSNSLGNQQILGFNSFLIYGPNIGKVDDLLQKIIQILKTNWDKQLSLIHFNSEIENKNKDFIDEQLNSEDLFGNKKAIICSFETIGVLSKKLNFNKLKESKFVKLIIRTGEIEKKNTARQLFEKSEHSLCIPCYEDNEVEKKAIFFDMLNKASISIPDEMSSSLDFKEFKERNILRQNAEKIICYILGGKKKLEENFKYILNEFSAFSMDELIYSVFSGNINSFEKSYQSVCNQGKNQITILNAFSRHAQKLKLYLSYYNKNKNVELSLRKLYPPIFFKQKDEFIYHTKIWEIKDLEVISNNLFDAEIQIKSGSFRHSLIDKKIFLNIVMTASQKRKTLNYKIIRS